MKILHVGKFYHPFAGGMETVLRSIAEGSVRAGHEVTVLCFAESRRGSRETMNGVEVIRVPTYGSLMSQPICPRMPKTLAREAANADIVHLHSPNPLAEYAALRLPREIPILDTYHADVTRQRLVLPAYQPLIRKFLDRCKRIVVATPKHIEHSPILAPIAEKCTVIPFGLDPERFVTTSRIQRIAERLNERHGEFILYVGRLVSYKGLQYLIEAMRDLPRHLVIVGTGPLGDKLKHQVRKLGLDSRVHLPGPIGDDEELLAHYKACRLFALPSVTAAEAFGMVLMEAMACGKPLVTSHLRSGVTFVNQDGVNGLHAKPGDAASLREALRRVIEDDELATRLGRAGRARFEAEFTTEAMVARHMELYSNESVLSPVAAM